MDSISEKMDRTKALLISLLEATMVAVAMNYKSVANDVFAGTSELFELWHDINVVKVPKGAPDYDDLLEDGCSEDGRPPEEIWTKDGRKVGPKASLYSETYVKYLDDQLTNAALQSVKADEDMLKIVAEKDSWKSRFNALSKDMDGTMNVINDQYAKIVELKCKIDRLEAKLEPKSEADIMAEKDYEAYQNRPLDMTKPEDLACFEAKSEDY